MGESVPKIQEGSINMDLQFLVGTELIEKVAAANNLKSYKKVKWTVIEAHPHFVKAMRITKDEVPIYTTFNTGDLVTMGKITSNGRRRYERQEINPQHKRRINQ